MKKTLRLVGVAAMVLLLAASCKKEEKNNGETRKVTFTAGIEQGGGAKTGLTPNGQVPHAFYQVWKDGDKISINGNVFKLEKGAETSSGTFTGEVALSDQGPYYAFYPAPEETQQRGDQDFSKVTFGLPSTQDYIEKSYQTNLAPMAVKSDNQQLTFTNLCGLMELSLVGDGITVTSLKLSCDKPICGQTAEYTIGGDAALAMPAEAGKTITMNCVSEELQQGVSLGKTDATSFIFVLPPVENGHFSLVVNYKKGDVNVFVETIDLTNMNISINASQVSYNNTAYEIGTVTTKGINESGASVEATTATILYTVDDLAGYTTKETGVCYGVNENPDLTGSCQTGSSRASSYKASLSGLSPNTHYYARAYAKYSPASKDGSDVVVYGNQIEFTTQSIGGTVTTGDVSLITATGAKVGYSVAPNTGSQATLHGICYSTSEHPVYTGSHVSGTDQSPYTVSVSSLTPNTTYYYRAYAIFAVASKDEPEVVYGEEKSFTTQSIGGTVTTGNVSSTTTGASVDYTFAPNAYSQATQHGVCYSTSQNPVATGSHVDGTGSSPCSVSLSGLTPNTHYYARAYAKYSPASKDGSDVVVYGNQIDFTTQAGSSAPEGFVDFGTHVGGVSTGKPLYWAECNLGAAKPEEYGDYYAFGHTYKYAMNGSGHGYVISYYNDTYAFGFYDGGGCDLRRYNDCDGLRELLPEDDCVWQANKTHNDANPTEVIRMPSLAEFDELFTKAYFEWTTGYKDTGVAGVIIYAVRDSSHAGQFGTQTGYSTSTDKHIFIPAAGYGDTGNNFISGQTQILNVWLKTIANYGTGKPYGLSIYITSSGIADHSAYGGYSHNFVNTRIRPCSIRPVRQGK